MPTRRCSLGLHSNDDDARGGFTPGDIARQAGQYTAARRGICSRCAGAGATSEETAVVEKCVCPFTPSLYARPFTPPKRRRRRAWIRADGQSRRSILREPIEVVDH